MASFSLLILIESSNSLILSKFFEKVDTYLRQNVKSSDLAENLAAAKSYMAELVKQPGVANDEILQALKDFTDLDQVSDDNLCSYETYQVLSRVLVKSYQQFTISSSFSTGRSRVDQMVNQLRDKRARACYSLYEREYERLAAEYHGQKMDAIDQLIGNLLDKTDDDEEELIEALGDMALSGSTDLLLSSLDQTTEKMRPSDLSGSGRKNTCAHYDSLYQEPCAGYLRDMGDLDRQEFFDRQSLARSEPEWVQRESLRLLVCEMIQWIKLPCA